MCFAGGSKSCAQKGAAGALARGAYGSVREHDKGPTSCLCELPRQSQRTPLTSFFNLLLRQKKTFPSKQEKGD